LDYFNRIACGVMVRQAHHDGTQDPVILSLSKDDAAIQ
jgi:hypothetical protein